MVPLLTVEKLSNNKTKYKFCEDKMCKETEQVYADNG